jgi:hypothetical protein
VVSKAGDEYLVEWKDDFGGLEQSLLGGCCTSELDIECDQSEMNLQAACGLWMLLGGSLRLGD